MKKSNVPSPRRLHNIHIFLSLLSCNSKFKAPVTMLAPSTNTSTYF